MIPGTIPIFSAGAPIDVASTGWTERGTADGGSTTKTISGATFGATVLFPNQRWIVVCIQSNDSSTPPSVTGTPTIGGISAPVIASGNTSAASLNVRFTWFAAEVPTGTSGNIVFTTNSTDGTFYQVFRCVNLNFTSAYDSAFDGGTTAASLAIDCPAGGGALGSGFYAYTSGSTPTSADFANLFTLNFVDSNIGYTASGNTFASAQTGLNTTYDPTPNTNLTRSHATVLSAPASF